VVTEPGRLAGSDAAALVAINLLWGASYVVTRATLETVPPLTLAWARFTLAWVAFCLIARIHQENGRPGSASSPAAASFRLLPAVGMVGFCLPFALFYHGLRLTTASDAALLVNLEAIFTALLGAVLLKERVGSRGAWGIGAALLGATLLLRPWGRGSVAGDPLTGRVIGNALVVAALLCEALATVLGRALRRTWEPLPLTRRLVGWGALGLLPLALVELGRAAATAPGGAAAWITPGGIAGIAYLSLGCTVLCYAVWYGLLGRIPAGRAAAFLYVQPVVGVALGVLLQGDRLDGLTLAGGALILGGVAVVARGAAGSRR
jgi:drug/metabolite transporter (DMT)-like permease